MVRQHEANLFLGRQKIRAWVEAATPDASREEVDRTPDKVMEGSGPVVIREAGEKVTNSGYFQQADATIVFANLSSGNVTRTDIGSRGLDALTAPKPRALRTRLERAKELWTKLSPQEKQAFTDGILSNSSATA